MQYQIFQSLKKFDFSKRESASLMTVGIFIFRLNQKWNQIRYLFFSSITHLFLISLIFYHGIEFNLHVLTSYVRSSRICDPTTSRTAYVIILFLCIRFLFLPLLFFDIFFSVTFLPHFSLLCMRFLLFFISNKVAPCWLSYLSPACC